MDAGARYSVWSYCNSMKFSPISSAVAQIWDLTAGKLLHDLKLHEGHIRSIDFHPMELLMATGLYMTDEFTDIYVFCFNLTFMAFLDGIFLCLHPLN